MSNDEPLYLDPTSGAHAHMTEDGEKICRDTMSCPVWIEWDDMMDEIAAIEDDAAYYEY